MVEVTTYTCHSCCEDENKCSNTWKAPGLVQSRQWRHVHSLLIATCLPYGLNPLKNKNEEQVAVYSPWLASPSFTCPIPLCSFSISILLLTLRPVPTTRVPLGRDDQTWFLLLLALLGTQYSQFPEPQPGHQDHCPVGDQTTIHSWRCTPWLPAWPQPANETREGQMRMLYPFNALYQEASWFGWRNVTHIFESFIKMLMFKWLYMVGWQRSRERHQGQLKGRGLDTVTWLVWMLMWNEACEAASKKPWRNVCFLSKKNSALLSHTHKHEHACCNLHPLIPGLHLVFS